MKVLFIGGPLDGKRYEVDKSQSYITVSILPKINTPIFYSEKLEPNAYTKRETAIYKRKEFVDLDKSHYFVYVHNSVKFPLLTLINGYKS